MRFESIRASNVGPFRNLNLDLSGVSGQLVAIVGENGAGKSTLLELLAGALYRRCPTRGTLSSLATARDSSLEVTAVNGSRWTIRHLVDGLSAKGESLVLDASGSPVLDSAKLKAFDAWSESHLPSESVLFSSSFAPQGRRGFLDLSPADRKRLLVQLLGLERYEQMAEAARERAKVSHGELGTLRGRLAEVPTPDHGALRAHADALEARLAQAVSDVAKARTALERAKAAASDESRAYELAQQRSAVESRLRGAREQLEGIQARIDKNRALLDRADEIRGAAARAAQLEAELQEACAAERVAEAQLDALRKAEESARRELGTARMAQQAAEKRLAGCQQRLGQRAAVQAAVAALPALREQEKAYENTIEVARSEAEQAQNLMLEGQGQRIQGLRGGLTAIASKDAWNSAETARHTLDADDSLATAITGTPAALENARKLERTAANALTSLRASIAEQERIAARAEDIARAESDVAEAQAELSAAHEQAKARGRAHHQALDELANFDGVTAAGKRARELGQALSQLESTLKLVPILDQAEARIEELAAQLAPVRASIAQAEAELAALPVVDFRGFSDLTDMERSLAFAEDSERTGREALARAKAAIEQADEAACKRASLQAAINAQEDELADWTRLAQDLGRDGLQALELDAALPEINALANDLLHSCVGPRFTVELRTTRLDASGKRELEALDFRVIDTVKGRDADASTYSGGECVICGEAVSLALTVLACRRSGIERPTLVRDESGAALSPENGRAYVAMLRRAASQIGADKVLFVSHTPELQELADARIVVANGTAEVQ